MRWVLSKQSGYGVQLTNPNKAHAMLPHLGLGASQGMEDANLLAKLLGNSRVSAQHIPVSTPTNLTSCATHPRVISYRTFFKDTTQVVDLRYRSTGKGVEWVERSTKDVGIMETQLLVFGKTCKVSWVNTGTGTLMKMSRRLRQS